MINGFLARPLPVAVTLATSSYGVDAAFPSSALIDPRPKVVFQMPAAGADWYVYIDVDLGADTSIDVVGLLFVNASAAAQWKVHGKTAAAGAFGGVGTETAGSQIFSTTGLGPFGVTPTVATNRRHAIQFGAAVTVRYVRFVLYDYYASNPEHLTRIGNVFVGLRWVPINTYENYELGSGRKLLDLSTRRDLDDGGLGIVRKAKVPAWKATWSNLTEAKMQELWALLTLVGESEPVLLVEDPDPATSGQAERIHYGVLDSLDFYSRQQTDKNTIELKVREWL